MVGDDRITHERARYMILIVELGSISIKFSVSQLQGQHAAGAQQLQLP